MVARNGRMTVADSTPTKMFAAVDRDSAPLIRMRRVKAFEKILMSQGMMPA
jgi:hypothetical protein